MACTAPDKDKIGSVMLYTRGFKTADVLSSKIVLLFQLCLDQLSSQLHYDFGLRALKSVLNSAGSLKRQLVEERELLQQAGHALSDNTTFETEVLIQSVYDTVVPKLVADDVVLLSSLVKDVFSGEHYSRFIKDNLRRNVLAACRKRNWRW